MKLSEYMGTKVVLLSFLSLSEVSREKHLEDMEHFIFMFCHLDRSEESHTQKAIVKKLVYRRQEK